MISIDLVKTDNSWNKGHNLILERIVNRLAYAYA